MSDLTYETMRRDAIARAERLRAIGVNPEDIVIVMTEDVYRFSAANDFNFSMTYRAERMATTAELYGYDVAIVNECADGAMETELMAASKGMNYYAGMEAGDIIIVYDETGTAHLYTLEAGPGAWFTDTGRTVRFEQEPLTTTHTNPVISGEALRMNYQPNMSFLDSVFLPSNYEFIGYADRLEHQTRATTTTSSLDANWDDILATIQQGTSAEWRRRVRCAVAPKTKPPKEPEFSPGDTKELDDFLNSFAKKPAT